MAANLRDPGSIPGGDPKRFQDSSNYVFHIVGECFSSAAGTHSATDLTCTDFWETFLYTIYRLLGLLGYYLDTAWTPLGDYLKMN